MTLDKETVHSIARLARLNIGESEVEKYQTGLSNILKLVEKMEQCDTSRIDPMTHPCDPTLRFREDCITEKNQREKFQTLAPNSEDGLYLVPKVID